MRNNLVIAALSGVAALAGVVTGQILQHDVARWKGFGFE
jgi:hypothetical protein